MSRPGLIIGLGGTGQWVLTWLKRDLLLSNSGQMPKTLRLLEFDTARRLEATATRITERGEKEEAAAVGGVMLDAMEFIHIGGNALSMVKDMDEKGAYPQIRKWFNAETWLRTQTQATFNLDEGAGRLRQFGRLAIYKDVLGGEVKSVIWRALVNAMEGVRASATQQHPLEIMLVGSFAGGTGSGTFIDMALILRLLANKYHIPHVMRGIFALPSVFTTQPTDDMKARCFAAWRELNRFMVVDEEFSMPEVAYIENNQNFSVHPNQRLFDACYLVDGRRNGQPLTDEAKTGVFPMLAEAISAFLDENAGTAYSEWILTNLATEYARTPNLPMYSAIGAFTVQVPAYFVVETSRHALAQNILLQLLRPQREPDSEGRLSAGDAGRLMALAAPDKNGEDPGFAGRSRSGNLFTEGIDSNDQIEKPSVFLQRVGQLIVDNKENQKKVANISRVAKAGAAASNEAAARDGWLGYFVNFGLDQELVQLRKDIEENLNVVIPKRYGKSDDKEPEDARRARLKKISEDMLKLFGAVKSSGEAEYGATGKLLGEVTRTQLRFFQRLVRSRVAKMLMGRSEENILVSRSGKLGYTYDFFDGAVKLLDEALEFMEAVRAERERMTPEAKLAGLTQQAQKMLTESMGKKLFWFWEHPDVLKSEQAYLQAQQRTMQLRREEVMHVFVAETLRQMKEICVEVRDALQRWIWHLATGDDASGLPGLWEGVRASLEEVHVAHGYDKTATKVQMIVAEATIPATDADLERALRQWEWEASFEGAPSKFSLQARIRAEAVDREDKDLRDPAGGASSQLRREISTTNQSALLELAGRRFVGVAVATTVADQLKRIYGSSPRKLAEEVAEVSAKPLFEGPTGANPRKQSNLIRIMADPNDPFFTGENGLEGILRGLHQLDRLKRGDTYAIQVVGSENPYKMTLVRTDDLYAYDAFDAWTQSLASYDQHRKNRELLDPVLMHNFAAEANAVGFERRIQRKTFKPLHPRVVMIMEDLKAVRQFVYLGMLGYIKDDAAGRLYKWDLSWEQNGRKRAFWLTRGWDAERDQGRRVKPSLLTALHGYAIKRVSQQEDQDTPIDFEFAERLINGKLQELGPQGEVELLEDKGLGLVEFLNVTAYEYPDDKGGLRPDYADLADLAVVLEMMISDWVADAKERTSRTATLGEQGNRPTSPFGGRKKNE
ncbi:MAG: hypothetical protein HYZ49_05795 [Chloroflexi bacterium]|nr:hypothetical protein [Chloroflexota bacterium]